MSGSLFTVGGWISGHKCNPPPPHRRCDPRQTAPDASDTWWKTEQKTREQELARRKAHRERQARLIHIPPKRT